jgi:hypothetical protein
MADTEAGGREPEAEEKALVMREMPPKFLHRKLWVAHVRRLRNYAYGVMSDLPPGEAATLLQRLKAGLGEIVAFWAKTTPSEVAGRLTSTLETHASVMADLALAIKSGDQAALTRANSAWHKNADELAAALAVKPSHTSALASMLHKQAGFVMEEAQAAKRKDWLEFSESYRKQFQHMVHFADTLFAERAG